MVFFPIYLFLGYANLIAAFRAMRPQGGNPLLFMGHMLAATAAAFGFLFGSELLPARQAIPIDATNWAPPLFLAMGAMTIVLFGIKLTRTATELKKAGARGRSTWRFGISLWAVLGGLYMCGTVADHYWFFRDPDHSGIADASLAGGDVSCRTMLLSRIDGNAVVYRCPNMFEFGRDYAEPFVPWPSYVEGRSTRMKTAIDQLSAEAARSKGGIVEVPASAIKLLPAQ